MAKRAETSRRPQSGWGRASRVAQGSLLAITIAAGASALPAEPLEADPVRSNPAALIAPERTATMSTPSQALSAPQMSVSAFSAAQSEAARVLLAQELSGESNRAVGTAPFPVTPQAAAEPRTGEAQNRVNEAAEAKEAEESAIVGRSLRAYTRAEEESEASSPRRRASFSSAISRAAAAGALTSTNPNASISNSLNAARFTPARNAGQFDPGFSQAAEVLSVVPGLRLESATIFGGYSSNSLPRGFSGAGASSPLRQNLGADYDLGASAIVSYSHQGRRSLTQFTYMPSHVQRSRIPEWSTTDHRLSFSSSRDLTPRLSLRANGNAGNSGLERFWTRPAVIRRVDMPASFAELMAKVQAGEISNDEFAAILTGSPVVDDPGGSEQGLSRIFSASLGTAASYAYSRRMTLNFGANSSMNRIIGDQAGQSAPASLYLSFARITSANASADYRLSSRTRVTMMHSTSLAASGYASSLAQSPSVALVQTLSRHWSYQAAAGLGTIHFTRIESGRDISDLTTWTASGGLGYSLGSHQVNLSAGKQVGDPLGFGSRSTVQANLAWNWQPRFSPWGAMAGIAYSRSDFGGDGRGLYFGRDFTSDLYSAGLSRRLTPSTTFRSDYFYGAFISPYSGIASNMSLHRLQMSLVWRPVEQR